MKIYKVRTKRDLKRIAELRIRTIKEFNSRFVPESDIKKLIKINDYPNLLRRVNKSYMFYAEKGNQIVGTIDLEKNEIKGLYVKVNHLNEGIGSRLLEFIEQYAVKKGLKSVIIDCNENSYGFYHKKGYRFKEEKYASIKSLKRRVGVGKRRRELIIINYIDADHLYMEKKL